MFELYALGAAHMKSSPSETDFTAKDKTKSFMFAYKEY